MPVPDEGGPDRARGVLAAVTSTVRELSRAARWEDAVPAVLRELGSAVSASRAYLFANSIRDDGELVMTQCFEWVADGIEPTIQLEDNVAFPYSDGHRRWADLLSAGKVVTGLTRGFPDAEREGLEDEDILSCVFVPVFEADAWWGYLGFDDCVRERTWSESEIDALRVAAEVLGGTIERHEQQHRVHEAERRYRALVEQIPAILYIDIAEESYRSIFVGPQLEPILGLTPEEWIKDPDLWERQMHPDDADRAAREYQEWIVRGGGDAMVQEYRMIRPDGREVWIRDEFRMIRGDEGDPDLIQGIMYDVTEQKLAEQQLREAEGNFRRLVEQVPAVIYMDSLDENATTTFISPGIEDLLGYTPEEWVGNPESWYGSLHPDDRDRAWDEYIAGRERGGPWSFEFRMIHKDGSVRWIREEDMVVRDSDGPPTMVQGVMYDFTEEHTAIEQLREAETKYKAIIEKIPAITYLDPVDEEAFSMYVSPQVESILGCTPDEWLTNQSWWHLHIHPDDEPRVWETYVQHRESGEPLTQEYRMVRDDDRVVWIREEATLLRDEDGEPWVIQGLMHDITDRKEAEEQVAFLAYHDSLTGLANRALLEEMLDPALARARRANMSVALLFMDLDGFKEVNDTLGHQAGDELLKEVADRLVEATRDTDVVARQGGDEFLVLLTDLEPGSEAEMVDGKDKAVQVAELMAQRIHTAMRAPVFVGEAEVHTSASIGISVFPLDAVDTRALLKNADAAMYESKKDRAGGYRLHSQAGKDPMTQLSLTRRLQRAVQDRDWVLHYQPVVDVRDGTMVGVEALLRWRRPRGDLVLPGEFLPLAEEMGLMEIIGEWVLEELARQARVWSDQGMELDISFNLSPRQLWQRDLADKIMKNLRDASVAPTRLIVEISESTAMTDPARTQKVLWTLHERGLRVAVDDFGTGYSPPARLKHLPVDVLKIDQPLIRDLPEDAEVANFLEAVVAFASELGITPLAVGVETEAQRTFLLDLGCRLAQGYLFSRPVPAEGIAAFRAAGDATG